MFSSDIIGRYEKGERNFQGLDLRGFDLSDGIGSYRKLDINGINLSRANLADSKFCCFWNQEINATNINFSNANLEGAIFSGVDLSNANFTGANLRRARLNASLDGANFTGADLTDAHIDYKLNEKLNGVSFRSANLTRADFGGIYSCDGLDFTDAICDETQLPCNLAGANFCSAKLETTFFKKRSIFGEHQTHLKECNLCEQNLSGKDFSYLSLEGSNLTAANLTGANLQSARLIGVNFTRTTLTGVNLIHANLTGAVLVNADLRGGDLRKANLTDADLTGADLTNARLDGVKWRGAKIEGAVGLTDEAVLIWAILNDDATSADFTSLSLSPSWLEGANLKGVNFTDANLAGSYLENADLESACLTGANFSETHLTGANMGGAIAINANFGHTKLDGANLSNADLRGANLTRASLINANLSGADLSAAELSEAIFNDANLTGANLTGVNLFKATYIGANFTLTINPPAAELNNEYKTPLTEALDRLYRWHFNNNPDIAVSLQPGLTRAQIDELLKDCGCAIPAEVYELYGWRNGMAEIRQHWIHWEEAAFIDTQNFLPLAKYSENVDNFDDCGAGEAIKQPYIVPFGQASDICGAYAILLGDEKVAPVINFDPEYRDYSPKYPSLRAMILTKVIELTRDLSGAYLNGVNMSGFQISGVNLTGANLENADLSRADLSRANLTGANLRGANLYQAGLFKADLTGADLTGADLSETDLYSVVFNNTIMPTGEIRNNT